jgi:hypothetical protein
MVVPDFSVNWTASTLCVPAAGQGRWEFVKPAAFVPFNHGYDTDYDCLDRSAFDPATGEYAIQYWSPPRILGEERYGSFPEYMEDCIRSWAETARSPVKDAVLSIIGQQKNRSPMTDAGSGRF